MKLDYGKRYGTRLKLFAVLFALLIQMMPISTAATTSPAVGSKLEVPKYFKPLTEEEIEALHNYDINDPNTIVVTQSPLRGRTALPKIVDNSKSKYFPEIMDQGVNGICYTASEVYYGYTYMTARQRDIDVKTLGKDVCFAPYQMASINVEDFGAALWNEAPLGPYSPSFRLPLAPYSNARLPENVPYKDAADWRYILKNKPLGKLFIDGSNMPTAEYIELLKIYLSQGYVLSATINTLNGMEFSSKNSPDSSLDDELYATSQFNNVIMGAHSLGFDHEITLVGYNDDVWVDVNANGIIESEELGAFKFANSWGDKWNKTGYGWIGYDAFFEKTQVLNHLYPNRNWGIHSSATVYLPREKLYTPQLLAEMNSKTTRNENPNVIDVNLYIGCRPFGSNDEVEYKEYTLIDYYDRVGYEGTRVYDLTDYVVENNLDLTNKKYEWYLKIDYHTKDLSSDMVRLNDFKLTDANGIVLASSAQELLFSGKTMSDGKNTYSPKYDSNRRRYDFSGTMMLNYGATARVNGPWDVIWQSANEATTTSIANNEVIESAQIPERDGYTFAGWYTDDRYANEAIFPYTVVDDVIFYAKWIRDGGTNLVYDINDLGAAIDLGSETLILPDEYSIAAYSTDGGSKWKQGSPNITSLLSKKLRLAISDTYDTGKKRPSVDSIILFPQIEARPKSNPDKLVINYAILDDKTGRTAGAWTLSKKGGKEAFTGNIEITLSQNKKTPDGDWMRIPEEGIPVQPYGSPKQTYLARTAPVADGERYVPASKPFKLTPLTLQKAPKWKPKYKYSVSGLLSNTEAFSLRPGDFIFGGSYQTLKNTDNPVIVKSNIEFDTGVICEAERGGVPVSALLDEATAGNPAVVCIWKYATEKKPASEIQEYTLAYRSVLSPQTITAASNGKITFPSTLEVYDKSKNKWGSLPKFTSTVTLEGAVRVKTTVRPTGKDDSSQLAASKPMDLTINYGVNPTTNKSGILSIVISEPNAISTVQAEQFDIEELVEQPQENGETQDELIEQDEFEVDAA